MFSLSSSLLLLVSALPVHCVIPFLSTSISRVGQLCSQANCAGFEQPKAPRKPLLGNKEGSVTASSVSALRGSSFHISLSQDRDGGASRFFKTLAPGHKGIQLEHLTRECRLGSGAYGEVCSYNLGLTTDEVAVKRGGKVSLNNEEMIYKILEQHPHPCIPRFHGMFSSSAHRGAMIIDRARGVRLTELGSLSESSKREAVKQLLSVLKHLASLGIAHRDLHAGNVLFDPETNRLTLFDFGLAEVGNLEAIQRDAFFASYLILSISTGFGLGMRELLFTPPHLWAETAVTGRGLSRDTAALLSTLLSNLSHPVEAYELAERMPWSESRSNNGDFKILRKHIYRYFE